jgi:uncharacterized protein (TIGR02246 family)
MKELRPAARPVFTPSAAAKMTADRRSLYLSLWLLLATGLALAVVAGLAARRANASPADDRQTVSALDEEYQAAVKKNDAATMARILADDFVLVTSSGKVYTKADMLKDANGDTTYEKNDEDVQTVRVWGNTAVVTAKLWEKYTTNGKLYEHRFWFSDTYVRTPAGWKYVFGQSSYCPCQTAHSEKQK